MTLCACVRVFAPVHTGALDDGGSLDKRGCAWGIFVGVEIMTLKEVGDTPEHEFAAVMGAHVSVD